MFEIDEKDELKERSKEVFEALEESVKNYQKAKKKLLYVQKQMAKPCAFVDYVITAISNTIVIINETDYGAQ